MLQVTAYINNLLARLVQKLSKRAPPIKTMWQWSFVPTARLRQRWRFQEQKQELEIELTPFIQKGEEKMIGQDTLRLIQPTNVVGIGQSGWNSHLQGHLQDWIGAKQSRRSARQDRRQVDYGEFKRFLNNLSDFPSR